VALLGGAGALGRFAVDKIVAVRTSSELPVGTFAINVSGSFVLGLLDGVALSGSAMLLVGTATIGAYTTFSTWMLETERLVEDGDFVAGLANIVLSVLVGFGAVVLGHLIGKQI
jgi:CrcB protein